jgi:hypothetical protein
VFGVLSGVDALNKTKEGVFYMFWLFLFALIVVAGIAITIWQRDAALLLLTLIAVLSALLVCVITTECIEEVVMENNTIQYEVVETNELYAVNDTMGINARGYLFSTYAESKLQYNYVIETPMGYDVKTVDADSCFIKHSNSDPQIEKLEVLPSNKVAKFFSIPWTMYVITVPEGTVAEEYNINLE